MTHPTMKERIESKLRTALTPVRLDVVNESELHAGHASSPGSGESHFRVVIVAERFRGRSLVERHRLVYELLAEELQGGVHALALHTSAPDEV